MLARYFEAANPERPAPTAAQILQIALLDLHRDRVHAAAATYAASDLADDDLVSWPAEAECSVCGERYAVPVHEAGDAANDEPVCPPCRMDAERAEIDR